MRWAMVGAVLAGLSVVIGAFGAHALADVIGDRMSVFDTAWRYHMAHALALVVVALLMERRPHRGLGVAAWCFVGGIAVFSGSLYALAITHMSWLGAITPVGGLAFMAGWAALAWGVAGRNAVST